MLATPSILYLYTRVKIFGEPRVNGILYRLSNLDFVVLGEKTNLTEAGLTSYNINYETNKDVGILLSCLCCMKLGCSPNMVTTSSETTSLTGRDKTR